VIDQRERFERAFELFDMPEPAMARLVARRHRKQRNRRVGTAVVAVAVAAAGIGGVARAFLSGPEPRPAEQPTSPFVGTWVSTDLDGSAQTMTVRTAGETAVEIVVRDDSASVCAGGPSTTTGTGRLDGATELVIPSPVLSCDDGSEPKVESGPPLEEQLRNLTFVHDPESDTLTDNLGLVWDRGGTTEASGGMWPQSSLEEVQRAQRLADAGDPRYTWQVLPEWPPYGPGGAPEMDPGDADIFVRFLQEKLGWEEFSWGVGPSLYPPPDWPWLFVVVRCAPGRTNPLYPNDPEGRECAPTIDEHRYETVRIGAEPVRIDDPSAIWVVSRWAMLQPSDAPIAGTQHFFDVQVQQRQVEQVVPPSDAEATAFLRAFLQARVDGEGAEDSLNPLADAQIPLLYATTSDAPYERFEFELVQGPVWPGGWMEFNVRLFAEGGRTVVEQPFVVDRGQDGRLGLVYGALGDEDAPTTENGEPLLEPYSILDGEVTLGVPPPWYGFFDYGPDTIALVNGPSPGEFAVLPDPLPVETGCRQGPAPADAEALARTIRSDPDFEATAPVTVGVGGIEALQMDVVSAAGASVCETEGSPEVLTLDDRDWRGLGLSQGDRMRLYLLDLPGGSSARILAIAFVAPEASFETVLEEAPRILDSFEFHTG
jgi:hypothetical protein